MLLVSFFFFSYFFKNVLLSPTAIKLPTILCVVDIGIPLHVANNVVAPYASKK